MPDIGFLRTQQSKFLASFRKARSAFLKWPPWLRGLLVFGPALAIFNLLSATSYLSYRWQLDTSHKIPVASAVVAEIDGALANVQRARAQARDYLLTGKSKSMRLYQDALQKLEASLGRLKNLELAEADKKRLQELGQLLAHQEPLTQRVSELKKEKEKASGMVLMGLQIKSAKAGAGSGERNVALAVQNAKEEENLSRIQAGFGEIRAAQLHELERLNAEAKNSSWIFVASIIVANLLAVALFYSAGNSLMFHIAASEKLAEDLAQLRLMADSAAEAVLGVDSLGACNYCNRAALRLLGYEAPSDLTGQNVHDLLFAQGEPMEIGEVGFEPPSRILEAMREGKNLHEEDAVVRRADGSPLAVEYWCSLAHDGGRVTGAVVTLLDISKAKATREGLARANQGLLSQLRELSMHSQEMTLFGQLSELLQASTSQAELCKVISVFAAQLFPSESGALYTRGQSGGPMEPAASWGPQPPAQIAFAAQDCWSIRRGKPHYESGGAEGLTCAHVPSSKGSSLCLPLVAQGETLGILNFRGPGAISESKQLLAVALAQQVALGVSNLRLREILRQDAIKDPLTGLFNRRFMLESLEHEVQRSLRGRGSLALVSFDLDHFKQVNDSLGHAAGDALLVGLADLARECIRAEDIPCRQGGDEFLLILPGISRADALSLAERLRRRAKELRTTAAFKGMACEFSLSMGVAMYPADGRTSQELQQAADRAMYRAKAEGRDRVAAASAETEEKDAA